MKKKEIQEKSEKIISLLALERRLTLVELCKTLNDSSTEIILALGSLIERETVCIYENENELVFEHNCSFSSIYY